MSVMTVVQRSPAQVVPGFIKRLDKLMEFAGFRAYGRQKVVSSFSGLSHAGVKKMYTEDRPPRPASLELLIENLSQAIGEIKRVQYTKQDIKDYLLLNQDRLELKLGDSETESHRNRKKENFDIADFVRNDPVGTSQAILQIENVAKKLNIDTSKDLEDSDIRLIQFRIISYCNKNNAASNSSKVMNMIETLLELASQNLL